jgi:hypothetical protein
MGGYVDPDSIASTTVARVASDGCSVMDFIELARFGAGMGAVRLVRAARIAQLTADSIDVARYFCTVPVDICSDIKSVQTLVGRDPQGLC